MKNRIYILFFRDLYYNEIMEWVILVLVLFCGGLLLGAAVGLNQLRRRADLNARRCLALAPRIHGLGQAFSRLARTQPRDPGGPYTPLITQASLSARSGWERTRRMEARLRSLPAAPRTRSRGELLRVLPFIQEDWEHLQVEFNLYWLEWQARRAEAELVTAQTRLEEAAGLGQQEQAAFEKLRTERTRLQQELIGHSLSAALAEEQKKLAELDERLLLAGLRLGTGDPAPADVAKVHPELAEVDKELQALRQGLRGREAAFQRQLADWDKLSQRLAALEAGLAEAEARGPLPGLRARLESARQALNQLRERLGQAAPAELDLALTSQSTQVKELDAALKKVSALRERLAESQAQAGRALAEVRQWMRQAPPDVQMDTAQDWVRDLQARLQQQARAASSEDPAELEQAMQLPLAEIRSGEADFEQALAAAHRLGDRLDAAAAGGLHKRGEHLAGRVGLRHSAYQEKAHLAELGSALARLDEAWRQLGPADLSRQSELAHLGPMLRQAQAAWDEVERGIERASAALEQAKSDQEKALACLDDEAFGELVGWSQQEGSEWAQTAGRLLEGRRLLAERAARGDENFGELCAEIETLRRDSAKLVKEAHFRLARAQLELTRLIEQLNALATRLDVLEKHAYLDFEEQAGPLLDQVRRWLGQAQVPALAGLERWTALAEQGAGLRGAAEPLCRALEAEAATAAQERAWTADLLATAEEYQQAARQQQLPNTFNGELASARGLLETARRKMEALAAPRRKYLLDEYRAELVDVRQVIDAARTHIDMVAAAA